MSKGITGKKPDPRVVYADIIDLPHWRSPTRQPMSLYNRAAQFASYKALSGYEDMVAEEARVTEAEHQPSERTMALLNRKLERIAALLAEGTRPELTFTMFVPDDRKTGGSYVTRTDTVKRIDFVGRQIILMSTKERGHIPNAIDFDRIASVQGEMIDDLEEEMF